MSSDNINVMDDVDNVEVYDYSRENKAVVKIEEQHLICCIVGSFGHNGGALVDVKSK